MDDVIIDNSKPVEVVVDGKTISLRAKSFGAYCLDLFIKALLMTVLISINFCLFAKAGNYAVFLSDGSLAPEVIRIVSWVFISSLVLMVLLSFSTWAQNILLAITAGMFVLMMLGQFALFDKYAFLTDMLRIYVNDGVADFVYGYSDVVVALVVFVLVLLYLVFADRSSLGYLLGSLLLINAYVLFTAYINRYAPHDFVEDVSPREISTETGKKFVNIILSNAASYNYLDSMLNQNVKDNSKVENLKKIMLGFFVKNGFNLYPNVLLKYQNGQQNQALALNPLAMGGIEQIVAPVIYDRDWQFDRINDKTIELQSNQVSDAFRKAGYQINAYQSRGLDMCRSRLAYQVDRCVNKLNTPANVDELATTVGQRSLLLVAQWLESSGLFGNEFAPSLIFRVVDKVTDAEKIPVVGKSYAKLYVVDSIKVFDKVLQDIANNPGKGAYYIYVDMPADMFVYNEFCMLKNQKDWIALKSPYSTTGDDDETLQKRQVAYAEQYTCLFGKLEDFVSKLDLANTVLLIQGISAPQTKLTNEATPFAMVIGNEKLTNIAIKDPKFDGFEVKPQMCYATDIINSYLFKTSKCSVDTGSDMEELKKSVEAINIDEKTQLEAKKFFELWIKYWNQANGKEVLPATEQEVENTASQGEVTAQPEPISDNIIVNKNIDIPGEVKLEDEVKVKSLKAEMMAQKASDAEVSEESEAKNVPEAEVDASAEPKEGE